MSPYCKTGSYLAVTILHAIYNFVGVFPVLFISKLTEFAGKTTEELSALPVEVYAEYRAVMAGYILFKLIVAAINIFGPSKCFARSVSEISGPKLPR